MAEKIGLERRKKMKAEETEFTLRELKGLLTICKRWKDELIQNRWWERVDIWVNPAIEKLEKKIESKKEVKEVLKEVEEEDES